MTPIPSSPIAQKTAKIGTRYVAVNRTPYSATPGWYKTGDAGTRVDPDDGWDIYALLDPTDAAELERLRKVEDEAADAMFAVWTDFTIYLDSPVTMAFCKARAARIAFEKKLTIN